MPNYTLGYKAFRVDTKGQLRYLFHAHEGSSLVQFDTWMTAKRKWVREAKGTRYRSGFHFLRNMDDVDKFMKLTKNTMREYYLISFSYLSFQAGGIMERTILTYAAEDELDTIRKVAQENHITIKSIKKQEALLWMDVIEQFEKIGTANVISPSTR